MSNYHFLQPFLVQEAQQAIEAARAVGLDPDLTLAYLEASCPEHELYDEPITPAELKLRHEDKRSSR